MHSRLTLHRVFIVRNVIHHQRVILASLWSRMQLLPQQVQTQAVGGSAPFEGWADTMQLASSPTTVLAHQAGPALRRQTHLCLSSPPDPGHRRDPAPSAWCRRTKQHKGPAKSQAGAPGPPETSPSIRFMSFPLEMTQPSTLIPTPGKQASNHRESVPSHRVRAAAALHASQHPTFEDPRGQTGTALPEAPTDRGGHVSSAGQRCPPRTPDLPP